MLSSTILHEFLKNLSYPQAQLQPKLGFFSTSYPDLIVSVNLLPTLRQGFYRFHRELIPPVLCLDLPPNVAIELGRFLPEQLPLTLALTGPSFEQFVSKFDEGTSRPIAPSPDLIVTAEMEILEPLAKKLICGQPCDS